jgi:hypothetical protein
VVPPDFAGDDEQRVGKIDRRLQGADLRRIGRVEHMQLRETGLRGEGFRQHFGPQARSAHAEHHGVVEILALHAVRIIHVVGDIGRRRAVEPAQPLVLVGPAPDRLVALPEPADLSRCAPLFGRLLDGLSDIAAKLQLLAVDAGA